MDELDDMPEVADELVTLDFPDEPLHTLSVGKRIIGLRVMPYGVVAVHNVYGPVMFERGAFISRDGGPVDASNVRLRMDHADPPTGIGIKADDRTDGLYMDFRVSKTSRGDDQLQLANDGVSRGASPGYREIVGRTRTEVINGRRVTVYGPRSAVLDEASTTWKPTFPDAGIQYVLSRDERGDGPMAEAQEAPAVGAIDTAPIASAISDGYDRLAEALSGARDNETMTRLLSQNEDILAHLREQSVNVPAGDGKPKPKLSDWVSVAVRRMRGEVVGSAELKTLALDDVVTTEQPGLVPAVFTPDYDDLINQDRPFLNTTQEIAPPVSGMTMTLPIITTRAVAGTQAGGAEKGVLTTTATKVGTGTFNYQSVFGGADISIQFINRAERGFFEILTGDMGMAYALDCEEKAITSLLAGYTDSASVAHAPQSGGALDPENLSLGAAWQNSIEAYRRGPTHIWMNSAAVASFIDAKATGTNAPLYSDLAASFTAGNGVGGRVSGLIPVYVPALDDESVDVIVGPSRGFVWAEDPARELRADNPSQAGRDIVLAGGIFAAPRFADAFTIYTLAS